MATIKLTIDTRRPFKDGRNPVVFRLTANKKSTSIGSGIKVLTKEWNFSKGKVLKTHSNYKSLNILLNKRLLELEKRLLEIPMGAELNLIQIKETLLNNNKKEYFINFANKEITDLRSKEKFGNAQVYETAVNRLLGFTGKDLTFDKINFSILSDFETYLVKQELSQNSISVYMRGLRAILNKAIKRGVFDKKFYPFYNYKIKAEKTVSRAITKDNLVNIKNIQLIEDTVEWHSRNIFFLIFNLIGISFVDLALLKHNSVQHGRVIYKRRKTGKIYSIKITKEAQRIMNIYKDVDSEYLISYLSINGISKAEERGAIALKLKTCNKYLKRLGKQLELPIPLTTYVARYTWANVAKSLGFSKDLIAESLGHNYGNSVTGIYLDNYGNDVIDEMNEKVVLQ